jgi:adenine phosphoribosyltransferase
VRGMSEPGTATDSERSAGTSEAFGRAAEALRAHIRDIPDFPQPGVVFKDITPMLATPAAFATVIDALAAVAAESGATHVAGIEARGFLLAAPVALRIGAGVIPVRKQGKLPGPTIAESYDLEYGSATLEVHADAFGPGDRVLLVDDVLATGGTAGAAQALVERAGAAAVGLTVLLELTFLPGRGRISPLPVDAVLLV